jgi:hypothetical protein
MIKELAIKHGEVIRVTHSDDEIGDWHDCYSFDAEQLAAYSAELLAQASSEPVATVKVYNEGGSGRFVVAEGINYLPNDTALYLANPLNTEMVETIKRLEEALREAMYSNSTAIAKDKAEKALASISPTAPIESEGKSCN